MERYHVEERNGAFGVVDTQDDNRVIWIFSPFTPQSDPALAQREAERYAAKQNECEEAA